MFAVLRKGPKMRYLKFLGILAVVSICLFSAPYAHAQRVVAGFGFGPTYVGPAPECPYGYYGEYPYACAPYGYYGPKWFSDGFFIGTGPWYGHYGEYYGRGYRRDFDDDGYYGRGFRRDFDDRRHDYGRGEFRGDFGRGGNGREGFRGEHGFRGGESRGEGFRGGESHRGGGFRGEGGFRGGGSHGGGFRGGESHGGGGWHGGGSHGGGHR